ncbi:MAG: hypothetical protein SFX74_06490 [Fimbriimonadaceae bacterium]|nr:hypothetical protein [Fimbriimonadaceae bacterium]
MAKQRVLRHQLEWNLPEGEGKVILESLIDDDADDTTIQVIEKLDDDGFYVAMRLLESGNDIYFDPKTMSLSTALVATGVGDLFDEDEEEDEFGTFIFDEDDEDEDDEDDEDEDEEDEDGEDGEKPTDGSQPKLIDPSAN